MSDFGLPHKTIEQIHEVFRRYTEVSKVVLYGSRAMGNYRTGSDIDLTLFGEHLTDNIRLHISSELDDLPIPYRVDISIFEDLTNTKLRDHIERVGRVFYERSAVSWEYVKLDEIALVIAGQSPKSEYYNKNGDGLPFYQGKRDYGERYLKMPTVWTNKITKEALADDILMSVMAPVGAINVSTDKICIGRGLAAIRANERVLNNYLYYFLTMISSELAGSSGVIYNSINKKQIENIVVLLPPLKQQRAIVAKLDAAFTEIDSAIMAAERKQEQLNKLKSALLSQELNLTSN